VCNWSAPERNVSTRSVQPKPKNVEKQKQTGGPIIFVLKYGLQ